MQIRKNELPSVAPKPFLGQVHPQKWQKLSVTVNNSSSGNRYYMFKAAGKALMVSTPQYHGTCPEVWEPETYLSFILILYLQLRLGKPALCPCSLSTLALACKASADRACMSWSVSSAIYYC